MEPGREAGDGTEGRLRRGHDPGAERGCGALRALAGRSQAEQALTQQLGFTGEARSETCILIASAAAAALSHAHARSVSNRLVIALAQIPAIVGDIAGNRDRLRKARKEAAAFGADIVMAPELYLSGYPPEDLVLKPAFQEACRAACEELARDTADGGPAALVGLPWVEDGKLYNAMALLDRGQIEAVRFKVDLPNYGVFDEKRVFAAGPSPGPIVFRGVRVGVPICEDIWGPDPVECILETGGEILLVRNASPYERDKLAIRQTIAVARVVESGLPLIYLNMVGGQDELAFDGGSFALNADRTLGAQLPAFRPMVARTVWERGETGWRCVEGPREVVEEGDEADYAACVMGLRDYVENNRFPGVVLGLSGGIDSALCAAMAVDALGAERVHAVMLPYRFTSNESLSDAAACAKALGLRYDIVPIAEPVEGVERALSGCSRASRATSPKRTSRAARAA